MIHFLRLRYISRYKCHDLIHDTYRSSEKQWRQIMISFITFLTPWALLSTLNPKSFHTFDLNEDGAGCNSTGEGILMNEPCVFAVGA